MQKIGRGGGADLFVVKQVGHIEAGNRRIEAHFVTVAIERPPERVAAAPAFQPGPRAFGWSMQQELAQAGQGPHLGRIGELASNAALKAPRLLGGNAALTIAFDQPRDPLPQEVTGRRSVLQAAQRREAARLATAQHQVGAARRSDQQLTAPVLVEEDHRPAPLDHGLFEHRQEEHEEGGLARADRPEDGRHAHVIDVRNVVVGGAAIGAEPARADPQ